MQQAIPTPLRLTHEAENKLALSPFDNIFDHFQVDSLADGTAFETLTSLISIFKDTYLGQLDSNDFIHQRLQTSAYDIKYHFHSIFDV